MSEEADKGVALNDDIGSTTTSTESETFESWTLITDKQKAKAAAKKPNPTPQSQAQQVKLREAPTAQLKDETDAAENAEDDNNSEIIKETDDFSDGISIISESGESVGRVSPAHPLLHEHLPSLPKLLKEAKSYTDAVDAVETDDDEGETNKAMPRRRRGTPTRDVSFLAIAKEFAAHPAVNIGLYTCCFMVLATLWGFLRVGQMNIEIKTIAEVEQKINELVLQNNLMSAEIDLLNKQVKYLTDYHESTRSGRGEKKNGNSFKAWSGNGNKMDAVYINKDDLKRAYKCDVDDKFVEVGGMCVEKTLIDEVGNIVNDNEVLQESETFKSFEKVAEAFLKKGNEKTNDDLIEPVPQSSDSHDAKYYKAHSADNSKEFKRNGMKNILKSQKKYDSGSDEDHNDSHEHNSHEKRHKRVYNSKERGNNSKERQYGSDNSKERPDHGEHKKQRKSYGSGEKPNKANRNAQWHENLMLQREELRRQRAKPHDEHNWYIERGDSREKARIS